MIEQKDKYSMCSTAKSSLILCNAILYTISCKNNKFSCITIELVTKQMCKEKLSAHGEDNSHRQILHCLLDQYLAHCTCQ